MSRDDTAHWLIRLLSGTGAAVVAMTYVLVFTDATLRGDVSLLPVAVGAFLGAFYDIVLASTFAYWVVYGEVKIAGVPPILYGPDPRPIFQEE